MGGMVTYQVGSIHHKVQTNIVGHSMDGMVTRYQVGSIKILSTNCTLLDTPWVAWSLSGWLY